jgi:hypothetical protein
MWSEKCDSDFFVQKFFVTIRSRDLIWSSHRQCFWLSNFDSASDAYSFSTRRVTYVRSRFVEQRMCLWWDDLDDRISSNWKRFIIWERLKNDLDSRILLNCERLIKSDESDLSSLMRTTREYWWDEISSNLWKIKKSHHTWRVCLCFFDKQSRRTISDVEKT